ncbi:Xanthine/uracil permease [Apilactobacillus kunkeei]|uniref:nucleobase:cation symporter-2 family protein n=1 Tax=Apilactobacillus kunkeei TaxID=148814 RepID=UPI0006B251C9|nr:nucleobase:cation symporter-2 family protein [Apilactobacillus kunkeei]KOY77340.1 Xanthine/uracil permease [Apilactobacillus kunkeei]
MDNHESNLQQVSQFKAAILGFQHLLAMYSGDVIVPLLIGAFLHFNTAQMTYLVSADIFMCGIATLLQLKKTPLTGIGLPVVLGCAVQVITPLETIGGTLGVAYIYGAIICSGLFVFLISGLFAKLRKFFPPVVTGSLITIIGFSLVPVAVQNLGGGNASAKNFADPHDLIVGLITMAVIILINIFGKGFFRSISVLVGMVFGTVIAYALGMISFASVAQASWFHFPQPFYFGTPHFSWSAILTMILVSLTTMVESTGVFLALGDLTGRKLSEKDLANGYRAEGIAAMLGGVFNTFPYSTFSENVGVVQLSGIKTKRPIYYAGLFLLILGLLPKAGAVATVIPSSVLGGAMVVMFGMVGVQGIRILQNVDFSKNANLLIVALSVGTGIGVTVYPQIFRSLPQAAQIILDNGIVVGGFLAVLLSFLFSLTGQIELED